MENELLDKEVICIVDIRQIQRFMLNVIKSKDTLGAGNIIISILDKALGYAVKNIASPLDESR